VLEASGYDVRSAGSAEEALSMLTGETVDIAILDMMMEENDSGAALAHRIRRCPGLAEVPIILVTAVAERTGFRVPLSTRQEREWLGVDAWLDKPVSPERLLREVERLTHD
jgi:CheY-like chemotaxis protein